MGERQELIYPANPLTHRGGPCVRAWQHRQKTRAFRQTKFFLDFFRNSLGPQLFVIPPLRTCVRDR